MKISIGAKTFDGPWGGGNLFVKNLAEYLRSKGHKVCFDLYSDDLDLILLTDPRKTSSSSAFTHKEIINYKKYINNDVLVVHRINECDERKNTNFVNKYLMYANTYSDYTVFVSSWIKNLYKEQGLNVENSSVILAGADKEIFNSDGFIPWDGKSKVKIVTHHWGANWNKGFDIYKQLDEIIEKESFSKKIEFSYIGNLPKKFQFKNTNVISPLSGKDLSDELKKHHIYLTASLNEPSGNHHIEGAQCGLPLLFINSGGIPEYSSGYGVVFNKSNFISKLNEIVNNYSLYSENVKKYPFNANSMSNEYLDLFSNLMKNKNKYIKNRRSKDENLSEKLIYNFKRRKIKKSKS